MQISDLRKGSFVINDRIVPSHGIVRSEPVGSQNKHWSIVWQFGSRKVLIAERYEVGSLRALYEFWKALTPAQERHLNRLESEAASEIARLKAFEDSYDPTAEDEQIARIAAMG